MHQYYKNNCRDSIEVLKERIVEICHDLVLIVGKKHSRSRRGIRFMGELYKELFDLSTQTERQEMIRNLAIIINAQDNIIGTVQQRNGYSAEPLLRTKTKQSGSRRRHQKLTISLSRRKNQSHVSTTNQLLQLWSETVDIYER